MEANEEAFTSPMREYLTQKLQTSFNFAGKEKKIKTFESSPADYEVRKVECYYTKEEAIKSGRPLDKFKKVKTERYGTLFLSSAWYEIFTHYVGDLFNEAGGNEEETAQDLLWLELQGEHFSYDSSRNEFEYNDEGSYFRYRSLNKKEKKFLDSLIKQKLDNLYLK